MLYPTTLMVIFGFGLVLVGEPLAGAVVLGLGVALTAYAVNRLRRQP